MGKFSRNQKCLYLLLEALPYVPDADQHEFDDSTLHQEIEEDETHGDEEYDYIISYI